MKSAATAVALALCAFVATAEIATYTPCHNGQQCTNWQGQQSRCNTLGTCMSNLEPCSNSSVLLQRCARYNPEFCYPLFDNGPLYCLDLSDIDPVISRDACAGDKPDGTKCVHAYSDMNGPSLDTATVFELEGICDQTECIGPIHASCKNKQLSDPCTYETIQKGNLVRFSGKCISPGFGLMNRCDPIGSATVISPGKVLASSPATPAPTTEPPTATKTPSSSSSASTTSSSPSSAGSAASDSDVSNPFGSIWTPYTFAPYVPETPRPPSYTYTSSSDGGSDPTLKILFGALGAVIAAVLFIVRLSRASSAKAAAAEAAAAPVVVADHPHTPGVDATYAKLEAGGAPQQTRQ